MQNLRAPSFAIFREKLVRLQQHVRNFLTTRRIRYKQFSDYLQMKSKKIILNLKHFYKINSKFNKMRNYLPKDPMTTVDQRRTLQGVNDSVSLIEHCFKQYSGKQLVANDAVVMPPGYQQQNDISPSQSIKKKNRWVQTSTSRSMSPETAFTQRTQNSQHATK